MSARSLAISKVLFLTALLTLPTAFAFAQNQAAAQVDDGAMLSALRFDLSALADKAAAQADAIDTTAQNETDINAPQGVGAYQSAAEANLPNYIELTKAAGSELDAKEYRAAANDFEQAATLFPGRTAAQLRAAIALALAGDEDKATAIAQKLEVLGDPATCQTAGNLLDAIASAKDSTVPPQTVEVQPTPAPAPDVPAPMVAAPEPAPAHNTDGPSTVDTLGWIVDKLNTLPNSFISSEYGPSGAAHKDDFNYGFVQTRMVVNHKNIWRLPDGAPVLTDLSADVDVNDITAVKVEPIEYGNMAGSSAITIETGGDDISVHKVVKDVGDPWNPRTNLDTTENTSSYELLVVSDDDIAQRVVKALQHIIDNNAASPHHEMF